MTPDETQLFELLDEYSRTRHKCFLAEMFLDKSGAEYVLCFRPASVSKDSPSRDACRYLQVGATEALKRGQAKTLSKDLMEKLDRELPLLRQSKD